MPHSSFRSIAVPNTILRCIAGSAAYGTGLKGNDDRDELGVCIEPPDYVIGTKRFEQWEYRDAEERAKAAGLPYKGVRSEPGDLDLKVYSLRKFAKLLVSGNPTGLLLLYTPEDCIVTRTPLGKELCDMAPAFASKTVARAFRHYLHDQRERLEGRRGQKRTKRPELVEKYGYDTKYAYQMLRLGLQGIEYLRTGSVTLPMFRPDREFLIGVREGRFTKSKLLKIAELYEDTLQSLEQTSNLPEEPDYTAINAFLVRAYLTHWEEKGLYRRG